MPRRLAPAILLALAALAAPAPARAFCGFYVGGADQKLFNNATMVVLMREGTRTVLSMQNNYQGPPDAFAMVVPVPVVLQKENVKTLPDGVFDRIDKLAAPRLVEYWERDPCAPPVPEPDMAARNAAPKVAPPAGAGGLGVHVEAQFEVGEYDVVILSASDSMGLDTWLRQNGYRIPDGAEPILRPYVQGGSKFFVAKVDVKKVKFEKGMAKLSPLRFHYDSDTFSLPVRLGLLSSPGTQDLIVHILARGQRYEVANYKNVTIPTNIDIDEKARDQFGAFYAALFDRTLEENPGAVVTEYAWDASTCDPCPSPALSPAELATLGADALFDPGETPFGPPGGITPAPPAPKPDAKPGTKPGAKGAAATPAPPAQPARRILVGGFVISRLHARYGKDSLGEDLVFRAAQPIWGGREVHGVDGRLESGAKLGSVNNFQGRYAIRHPWAGPIACASPVRGVWGGPPGGAQPATRAAQDLAFAPRGGIQLPALVRQDVPEIHVKADSPAPLIVPTPPAPGPSDPASPEPPAAPDADAEDTRSCAACAAVGAPNHAPPRGALFALAALVALLRRRR